MKNTGLIIFIFLGVIFLAYMKFMPEITWKELVLGYCLILMVLFNVAISKQLEILSDKTSEMDRLSSMLERKLDAMLAKMKNIEGQLGDRR